MNLKKIYTDTLVEEIGGKHKIRWSKLLEFPRKIKNDKYFIDYEKKKL
jgi:hypothetical protein